MRCLAGTLLHSLRVRGKSMPKKMDRCVKKVSKTKGKSSAYAICTAAMKKAKKK